MKKTHTLVSVLIGSLLVASSAVAAPAKKSKKPSESPSNAVLAEPPPMTEATPVEHVVPETEPTSDKDLVTHKTRFFDGVLLALFTNASIFNEAIRELNTVAASAGNSGKLSEVKNAWGGRLRFGTELVEDFPIYAVFGASVFSASKEQKMTSGSTSYDAKAESTMFLPTVGIRYFFSQQAFETYASGDVGIAIASTTLDGPNSTWPYYTKNEASGRGLAMGLELGVNIPLVSDVKLNLNGGYQYARVSTLKVRSSTGSNTVAEDSTLLTASGKKLQLDYSGPFAGVGIFVSF